MYLKIVSEYCNFAQYLVITHHAAPDFHSSQLASLLQISVTLLPSGDHGVQSQLHPDMVSPLYQSEGEVHVLDNYLPRTYDNQIIDIFSINVYFCIKYEPPTLPHLL